MGTNHGKVLAWDHALSPGARDSYRSYGLRPGRAAASTRTPGTATPLTATGSSPVSPTRRCATRWCSPVTSIWTGRPRCMSDSTIRRRPRWRPNWSRPRSAPAATGRTRATTSPRCWPRTPHSVLQQPSRLGRADVPADSEAVVQHEVGQDVRPVSECPRLDVESVVDEEGEVGRGLRGGA